MTLTKQIIAQVVKDAVKSELEDFKSETKAEFTKINKKLEKLDSIENTVINFAGQVKTFDTEQIFQGARVSSNTDRIENLELKVFGAVQMA